MPINCIDKYKNNFAIKFANLMEGNLPRWKRLQMKCIKKIFSLRSCILYCVIIIFCLLMKNVIVLFIILFIVILDNLKRINKSYQRKIKHELFPKLVKIFGDVNYGGTIPFKIYDESMLFKQEANSIQKDDSFNGTYKNVPFTIVETDINYTEWKNNKLEKYEHLFKGITMHFEMHKKIKSRVLIYSKNLIPDKLPNGFEKVEMELESFNKKYNVYVEKMHQTAEGQIEARYLFNTLFLERFMQLQTSFKVDKIRCSICENSVLILLETKKDLFEMNHLLNRIDDINQYKYLFDEFASIFSFVEILNLSSRTGL